MNFYETKQVRKLTFFVSDRKRKFCCFGEHDPDKRDHRAKVNNSAFVAATVHSFIIFSRNFKLI